MRVTCMYMWMCAHVHAIACNVCVYVHPYLSVYVHICTWIISTCVHVHVYIHACIHTLIPTYLRIIPLLTALDQYLLYLYFIYKKSEW